MRLSQSEPGRSLPSPGRRGGLTIVDGRALHHSVQFYESDEFLVRSVCDFLMAGFRDREPAVIIATSQHRQAIALELSARGVDVEASRRRGELVELDARATLDTFMSEGTPHEARFVAAIGDVLEATYRRRRKRSVHAFGEMVNLLWRDGNGAAALALESLWNKLADSYQFSLLCGYDMSSFDDAADAAMVSSICAEHTHVVPTERYVEREETAKLLEITLLQQRAQALEAEIRRREVLEATLRSAVIEREELLASERLARIEAERARQLAEEANRARSEFLAIMSHELRTPLNAIAGYTELLELGVQGPISAAQRHALERIQRSQRHLLGLINQVLNYARLETGSVQFELVRLSLDESIRAAESLIMLQMQANGLRYRFAGCSPDLLVRADAEKLQQILLNLLANAAKFTERGGEVTVEGAVVDGRAHVRVRDTGVGIPADKLAAIFDPFVQIDSRYTRTREGVGLGLAISRDLARGMDGDLTVESTIGVGSTFTLTLPLAPSR